MVRVETDRPCEMLLDREINASALTRAHDSSKALSTPDDGVGEGGTSCATLGLGRVMNRRDHHSRHSLESISSLIYTGGMSWDVRLWEDVESWVLGLDDETYNLVAAAITRLEFEGPTLGRPTADRIKGSRHHNMKELRPGSAGRSEIRILFAFDPKRRAILLVAGDKAGRWRQWYDQNIPIADDRFDEWLTNEEE